LPLIDVQERASGPELIGGNHERRFSRSGRNMVIPYELLLQASIHRHYISNRAFWPLQRKSFARIQLSPFPHQSKQPRTLRFMTQADVHSIVVIPRTSTSTAFRADYGIYEVRFCPESGSSPLQAALPKSARNGSGHQVALIARTSAARSSTGIVGSSTFHQVGRQRRQPVMLAIRPTVFNRYVAAHKITSFTQTFEECR
jgi:hypothetical protein